VYDVLGAELNLGSAFDFVAQNFTKVCGQSLRIVAAVPETSKEPCLVTANCLTALPIPLRSHAAQRRASAAGRARSARTVRWKRWLYRTRHSNQREDGPYYERHASAPLQHKISALKNTKRLVTNAAEYVICHLIGVEAGLGIFKAISLP